MLSSPYKKLPKRSYWRTGVKKSGGERPSEIYKKKWDITPDDKIATAGSCFAQHIGKHLRANGFCLMDVEPAPIGLAAEKLNQFGYNIYSARYGNIYTTRQLLQLSEEAFGLRPLINRVWTDEKGRYFDPFRPSVEPDGLDSEEEVLRHREFHVGKVRLLLEECDVFVFTLGLTEVWQERDSGIVFPTAPGTIAGDYNPEIYEFKNLEVEEIVSDFLAFRDLINSKREEIGRPALRVLLTVSPVPLAATASGNHVMVATSYSKAVLRAAAGKLSDCHPDIDYFPSFELISNPWFSGCHFDEDLRSVKNSSVAFVMETFLEAHHPGTKKTAPLVKDNATEPQRADKKADTALAPDKDVICEEALLSAFSDEHST